MKFRPLHDRVVIRRAESDTKSKGGIIIPDNAKEKPQEGEVIAVGPGARDESGALIALDVKAGDLILFGKWSGTEVKIDGEDLLIMKEADIMGIIDKSEMGIIDKSEMGIIEKTGAAKKAADWSAARLGRAKDAPNF
ncbi:co-chaperone GroES [Mesorhizobium sp.]|nr:co-chaperone GroES [Mesorhizobium sp.]TIL43087.1 MAG: co-chaperone GroES [Mesorhizobium sp.]